MRSTIEVFQNGQWVPAAEINPIGAGPYTATFEYRIDYVFGANPVPVSFLLPVNTDRAGFGDKGAPPCPSFLLDLVPQGRGRQYLARELGINDGERHDLLMTQYGAFNPVGNLRMDTAVEFYQKHTAQQGTEAEVQGFTLDGMLRKKEDFLEHLWIYAMLSAGTTGVQGAAPKFLLTQDHDGLWYADAALRDDRAAKHWLVKLPRGSHETDFAVLRNEAAYLAVAERCGIRTGGAPLFHQDMLFVQRFDRRVDEAGLHRLHQESLASLANLRGFGLPVSLFELAEAFRPHVTDPVGETFEFLKRDILNMAMRNTDNHARNTAVQRLPDGTVQLTPLYDFAPMYMDRELIARGCKWRYGTGPEIADWREIIRRMQFSDAEKQDIVEGIRAFQPVVEGLPALMESCGVDAKIIDDCKPHIEAQVARLEQLHAMPTNERKVSNGPTP